MTYTIGDASPKRAAALRVGDELRRALAARGMSLKALSRAMGGTSHNRLWHYSTGRNLPRLDSAVEISDLLAWPRIAELVRAARSSVCAHCGRAWVMQGGSNNKRYCSAACRDAAAKLRAHLGQAADAAGDGDPERRLVARIRAELDRVRPTTAAISRSELRDAIDEYERGAPQSRRRAAINDRDRHMAAVEAFCNACEPEGVCRDADCPLRPVSPLPYAAAAVRQAVPEPPGRWGRPGAREALSASLRARHAANPAWAEATGRAMRARWAAMTPEQRREQGRRISVARTKRAER